MGQRLPAENGLRNQGKARRSRGTGILKKTVLTYLSLFTAHVHAQELSNLTNTAWLTNSYWDQGKAEVTTYTAEEMRYGIKRKTEAKFIIVKEDMNLDEKVKTEGGSHVGSTPIIKFNHIVTVPTAMYDYHLMFTQFLDKQTFKPFKATFTTQDGCGQTFKELVFDPLKIVLHYHSYWEHEATGEKEFKNDANLITYQSLPVFLRSLKLDAKATLNVHLFPDLSANKVGTPQIEDAVITLEGKVKNRYHVSVQNKNAPGKDKFEFETAFPYKLHYWQRPNGTTYSLKKHLFTDYWNQNTVRPEVLKSASVKPFQK